MELILKCAGVAVLGTILTMLTKKQEFSILSSMGTIVLILGLALTLLRPVLTFLDTLRDTAGLGSGTTGPVLKALAIGLLTSIGANLCEDAGEKTIGEALKMAGGIAAVYVLLPLMESLLQLLEKML